MLHQAALGETEGRAILSLPREGGKINRGRASLLDRHLGGVEITVPVRRLDDLGLREVAFVKCDVEGFELPVLRGAERLLADDQPVLLIEIEEQHAGERVAQTFRLLADHGYVVAVYDESTGAMARVAADIPDVPTMAAQWTGGGDVYNFFFVPDSRLDALAGASLLGRA